MNRNRLNISIKYKLILLLTIIPVVSLAIYIALATQLFEDDKIAYVKDSSVAVARSLATQLRLETTTFVERIRPIIENYDYNSQKFTEYSKAQFDKQDRLDALILFQKSAAGDYKLLGQMSRDNDFSKRLLANDNLLNQLNISVQYEEFNVKAMPESSMHLLLTTRFGLPDQVGHVVAIGLYRASDIYKAFDKSTIYKHHLLDINNKIQIGAALKTEDADLFNVLNGLNLPEGAVDITGANPKILSYSDVGVSNLRVTAVVQKSDALAAVDALLIKSILFFLALIASTVIISVLASIKLTATLRDLYDATRKIAQGDFAIRITKTSNDEIGGLADGFNLMAGEVSRLMLETSEKARMATELETVKIVQETLFPASSCRFGDFNVVGHFESASECGGDWWNYCIIDKKLYLWIGDATGHGAPAALVTSAAKSASSIIEDLPFITPSKALEIMNKAIHETAKGKILMTFFLAAIDLKTGEITYANASHEPPYLVRNGNGQKVTKKNLEPMISASGPRLGDRRDATYIEAKAQLYPGDTIVFYTDGITDVKNLAGEHWGERHFIRSIMAAATECVGANDRVDHIKNTISTYRQNTELIDDVTLFVCQYEGAS
jgi:sigma-B regulation protein RsbU (phosphoserine phosphatase)